MDTRRRVLTWLPLAAAAGVGRAAPPTAAPALRLKAATIGVSPYGVRGADGGTGGLVPEVMAALAVRSGIKIDNIVVPHARAVAMMASGDADLTMSIDNSRLASIARPLALVFDTELVAIGRAGSHCASLAELRGKVVAHIRGAEYNPAFDGDASIHKHEATSIEQELKMLLEGRVDAVVGSSEALLYTLRSMGRPREQLGKPLSIGRIYNRLYLSRRVKDGAVSETLTRAMNALRDDGTVAELRKRYFAGLPDQ